jgi:hypothetical protein
MNFFTCFLICTAMALVNLPFVMQEGGSMINLLAMIICGALALYSLVMSVVHDYR